MHLYRFDDDKIVSAKDASIARDIYERSTNTFSAGSPHQLYGHITFAWGESMKLATPAGAEVECIDGIVYANADADDWANHWTNSIVEFQHWGEQ
jgi:hypothetical protein